jgi:hypothetical protein
MKMNWFKKFKMLWKKWGPTQRIMFSFMLIFGILGLFAGGKGIVNIDSPGSITILGDNNSLNINPDLDEILKLSLLNSEEEMLEGGKWKKTLTYGSEYGVALSFAEIYLKFNSDFEDISDYLSSSGPVMRMNSQNMFSNDRTEYYHSESNINPNTYLIIEIISDEPLAIIDSFP